MPPNPRSGLLDNGNLPRYQGVANQSRDEESSPLTSNSKPCCSDSDGEVHNGPGKTIGNIGSMAIAVNALAGPAILQLPFTYQQSGIIPTTVALLLVGGISALCCMHMANVVSKMPGNSKFDHVVEYSDPFRAFWGDKAYYATQIIFYLCTLCMNIAAIVDTAQIVDSFLGHSTLRTVAFAFDDGEFQEWSHVRPCSRRSVKLGHCLPFVSSDPEDYGNYILTLGYIITSIIFLPVCLMDLKENTAWQIFGFAVLMTISSQFVFCFVQDGLNPQHLSWWGTSWDSLLGVILFNFGLVLAIPAWLAEKKETVKVDTIVYGSTALSIVLYMGVGILGALAIPHVNSNMLEPMTSGAFGISLRWGASVFAFFIIGLDIPLFAVLTRYNLVHSGLCSTQIANLLVVYIPWAMSWMFYQGQAISELLSWGGILFTGALAFWLPLYLATLALRHVDALGSLDTYWGVWSTRSDQLKATRALLFLSTICLVVAIAGQLYSDETQASLLESESYVNDELHNHGVDYL